MTKIIGLKGKAGVGKDTVGKYLHTRYTFRKIALADPLKEIVAIITGWPLHLIKGESLESRNFRETEVHPDLGMTCREILQHIGTELFRNHFDPETWIKIARRQIMESVKENYDIVVTDIRFDNEAQMILDLGGEIWNIKGGHATLLGDFNENQVTISETASKHISERRFEVEGEKTIKNNKTLCELYARIEELLI